MTTHYKARLEQAEQDRQVLTKQIEMFKQEIQATETQHKQVVADWSSKCDAANQQLTATSDKLAKTLTELQVEKQVGRY